LKPLGGSKSDDFNTVVVNQALATLWPKSDSEGRVRQRNAVLAAMSGTRPRDEFEGMLAAQIVATHNAAMECFSRAMIEDQPFEGRRENLNLANKLTRSFTTLLEALDRHRGKGQQQITVEHVHVNRGGQAIVGTVNRGNGVQGEGAKQTNDAITHRPETPMRCANPERQTVPITTGNGADPL